MSAKPLVLVDGSSYLYRAFHALPALSTARGEPTGAVLGVVNMLYKLLDDYAPTSMAVVFDAPGRTFRDDLFAEYKANRTPMPDELRAQIEPLLETIDAMGIPLLRVEGVEADDVIGTLACQASAAGQSTVISTGDKDLAQLVDEHVRLVNTMDGSALDRDGVVAKFGVAPEQIIDYLALVGDSSDNIPGVPGVGPKTAAKWLQQYRDLDTLKAHAGEISGKVGERLREALPDLDLSKRLATIRCDLEMPIAAADLALRKPDKPRLVTLFERLEFSRHLRRVRDAESQEAAGLAVAAATKVEGRYETIATQEQLDRWIARLTSAEIAALEIETTAGGYMLAELVGVALAVAPGEAAYVPVAHSYPGTPDQLDPAAVIARLRGWLEGSAPKVGHQIKRDAHVLDSLGVTLGGVANDTMLESYVLNSTAARHDVGSVAAAYLGVETLKYETVAGKGAKQLSFDQVDVASATRYACERADLALRLHQALGARLAAVPELERVYREIELPVVRVLERMEHAGVLVDAAMLRRQSQELAAAMAAAEHAAFEAAGGPFNLGSPKQLQDVLYERLKLPVLGKTPKGQPSTAEDVLEQLAEQHALPRLVLEHRALSKLKSTYTDKLPSEIHPRTGRIHTSYEQAVAATGRL
ncbi:MAG TPA: DNA polymerase, partial [Gammaproteobacteria bacterium]|nr:DNA polymerase [Gammaproteobacteria bacterium]